jgi:hypothetical protein
LRGRDSETPSSRRQYTHGGRLTILAGIVAALRRRVECDSQPFRSRTFASTGVGDVAMRAFGGYVLLFGLLAVSLVVLGWLVLLGLRWL